MTLSLIIAKNPYVLLSKANFIFKQIFFLQHIDIDQQCHADLADLLALNALVKSAFVPAIVCSINSYLFREKNIHEFFSLA